MEERFADELALKRFWSMMFTSPFDDARSLRVYIKSGRKVDNSYYEDMAHGLIDAYFCKDYDWVLKDFLGYSPEEYRKILKKEITPDILCFIKRMNNKKKSSVKKRKKDFFELIQKELF